jgi:hypothetical protein
VQLHRFLADLAGRVGHLHLGGRHHAGALGGVVGMTTVLAARMAIERACSVQITISTMRCCSTWNDPIGHAELLALLHVVQRGVVGALHRADGVGAQQRGGEVDAPRRWRQRATLGPSSASAPSCTPVKRDVGHGRRPSTVRLGFRPRRPPPASTRNRLTPCGPPAAA